MPLPVAWEPTPVAVLLLLLACDWWPVAVLLKPVASEPWPVAVELPPEATAPIPVAVSPAARAGVEAPVVAVSATAWARKSREAMVEILRLLIPLGRKASKPLVLSCRVPTQQGAHD